MFKRICKITFISHGATIYSLAGIINDNLNSPKLNDIGEDEIDKVCEYLKKRAVAYDHIYTSPYAYCLQSAQIVAKLFKEKSKTIDLFSRQHGEWQGTTWSDLFKEHGSLLFTKVPQGGESLDTFNKKVWKSIKTLVKENKGNRIIVVTTPEVIQSALAQALELSPENQHRILIKSGSLTQINYFDGWASVIYSNYNPL